MKKNPLVSIVIPVYNGANYMREAIDSALAQTYPNIEVIVVNDGSTDNTREIALSYGDRIRYFEKENGGVSTALNFGISEMRGEYFSWLSHDDIYYPQKIELELDAIHERGDELQIVYSAWEWMYMPSRFTEEISVNFFGKNMLETGAIVVAWGAIHGCSLLIHKHLFEQYGLFDCTLRAVQDYKLWFQMFRGKRLVYLNTPLVIGRIHEGQVTNKYEKMTDEEDWLYKWMLQSFTPKDVMDSEMDLYQFYGGILTRLHLRNFHSALDYAISQLRCLHETKGAEALRERLWRKIAGEFHWPIYLYCMGKRLMDVLPQLQLRGIQIAGISDSDERKWGRMIGKFRCLPPREIPKDVAILVTKYNAQEVVDELRKVGYKHILAYDDIFDDIVHTPIIRAEMENMKWMMKD